MIPTVGRVVHYWSGEEWAAIITKVRANPNRELPHLAPTLERDYLVSLLVFGEHDGSDFRRQYVPFSETGGQDGHWYWPRIVGAGR